MNVHPCTVRRPPRLHRNVSTKLIPGWFLWPVLTEKPLPGRKNNDQRRKERADTLRIALKRPGVSLKLPEPDQESSIASNALPFPSTSTESPTASVPQAAAIPALPRSSALIQVLPWLYAADQGRPDLKGLEYISSHLALEKVYLLNVSKLIVAASESRLCALQQQQQQPKDYAWIGDSQFPNPVLSSAAGIHRMFHKVGRATLTPGKPLPDTDGRAVIIAFNPEDKAVAHAAIALWLWLYGGLEKKEAVAAIATSTGSGSVSTLDVSMESAVDAAVLAMDGYLHRVRIAWPHAGRSVDAAGDAVGGWDCRLPLSFSVAKKEWRLKLWGLPPGQHAFKFLVDGVWCVDTAQPTEIDAWGNQNNIVLVPSEPSFATIAPEAEEMAAVNVSDGMAGVILPNVTANEIRDSPAAAMGEDGRVNRARLGLSVLALHSKASA